MFGFSIAVDGDTLVAGAAQPPDGGTRVGSAYAFVSKAGSWQEQAHLVSPKVEGATMGWSIALQGNVAVVGAPGVNLRGEASIAGRVFVFQRAQELWTLSQTLTSGRSRVGDYFGTGVGLSGPTLVVGGNGADSGAGSAFLFAHDVDRWVETAALGPRILDADDGIGLCAAVNQRAILIGMPFEDGASTGFGGDPASNAASESGVLYLYR